LAGKNKIINGDFNIWQRGTSFSNPAALAYNADRWYSYYDGSGASFTISQQAFTAGTAPVAGYESTYFARYNVTVAGSGASIRHFAQKIEDVRTLAGQTVTVSVWMKADSARTVYLNLGQSFGSGGSSDVSYNGPAITLSTSWARYTFTTTLNNLGGKTIGAGNYLFFYVLQPLNTTFTIDYWGVQVEAGSVATPFTTASNTLQGELALCQRYYWRNSATSTYTPVAYGFATSSTNAAATIFFPVTMRTNPSSIDFSTLQANDTQAGYVVSAVAFSGTEIGTQSTTVNFTTASGLTQYRPAKILSNGSTSGYLGFSAEL
jgi:Carbohydrate binding domain